MSKWSIIWAAVKGAFVPGTSVFESVTDLALRNLNDYIGQENIADNVAKTYKTVTQCLGVLDALASFCPKKWAPQYETTLNAVRTLAVAFEDGKVDKAEVEQCKGAFVKAYEAWDS